MTTLAFTSQSSPGFPLHAAGATGAPADPAVLERNLAAMSRASARTAELVRACAPRTDMRFLLTDEAGPSIEMVDPIGLAAPRALASRRRPLREAEQLAETIDPSTTAAVAVMGFGAGYHVGALARRMRRTGVIAVFEPDAALLRAVLERIDHSEWLGASNTVIFTDPDDAAAISSSLCGVEGIVMMGLSLLEHAPSMDRLGEARTRFYRNLQNVVAAVRTTVATTMVQVRTTVANVTRNLPWYVSAPGIAELAGTRAGTPAIVVSAGPSLQRNIDQLARPGVRERFTIIAAQTVLKPLLARGIRPHYVAALDHSEISARFYEGLTREDVEGVTLVVEPKVSPAVPLAFPGEVRLARDPFLDLLLGAELSRDMGTLPPGATVAHLAYYLARHLGADPVVLVGQDLGFTDGQYYAAGAAIHAVWACELNQFNSLERMEWERIKRMGAHLRRASDHLGRPVFTDEQLATYLVQFGRDFQADTQRGMTIIDSTEGGVAKRHTRAEPLSTVIDRVLDSNVSASRPADPRRTPLDQCRLRPVLDRVRFVQQGVQRVAELSRKTVSLLGEMLVNHADQRRVGRLIDEVHHLRDQVEATSPAIDLVHYLNQAGAFSRIRADRSIQLDAGLTPLQRQKREIERDIANVELLARTADDLGVELAAGAEALERWHAGALSRDVVAAVGLPGPLHASLKSTARAHAVISVVRGATRVLGAGFTPLQLTVQRLARARRLDSIVVLAEDVQTASAELRGIATPIPVRVQPCPELFGASHATIRAARAGAGDCWRAGLAGASVYDEVLAPGATMSAMKDLSIDGALIVGADWCLVDPVLCDEVIARSERAAGSHRLAFSQAPPSAAGIFLNRSLLADLVKLRRGVSPFATIGGLLSYLPSAPSVDPIGRDGCAGIDPALRDLGLRLVPDSPARAALIRGVIDAIGHEKAVSSSLSDLIPLITRLADESPLPPTSLVVELAAHSALSDQTITAAIADFVRSSPASLLTLRDGALQLPRLRNCIAAARDAGEVFCHVRTSWTAEVEPCELLALGADIISIDLPSPTDTTRWNAIHHSIEAIVKAARAREADGTSATWIVPRLLKRDASYPALEEFFDRWLLTTGAAAIDALPDVRPGERIAPLPLPSAAERRLDRSAMLIRADGTAHPGDYFDRTPCAAPAADISTHSFAESWRRVLAARRQASTGGTP